MIALTPADKLNPLWGKLQEMWTERLALLRGQNDNDRSEVETAKLRGRIAEVKSLLQLDEDPPDFAA